MMARQNLAERHADSLSEYSVFTLIRSEANREYRTVT